VRKLRGCIKTGSDLKHSVHGTAKVAHILNPPYEVWPEFTSSRARPNGFFDGAANHAGSIGVGASTLNPIDAPLSLPHSHYGLWVDR
jgi:hypothetical protein